MGDEVDWAGGDLGHPILSLDLGFLGDEFCQLWGDLVAFLGGATPSLLVRGQLPAPPLGSGF